MADTKHAHGVGVVVEALHETLSHVLVDERVVRDVVTPLLELGRGRKLTVDQEVRDLQIARRFGQLLDRIAAVAEDAVLAVQLGDGALRRGGHSERRVVEPGTGHQLGPGLGVDAAVDDGDFDRLTGAVVGDGDGVCH